MSTHGFRSLSRALTLASISTTSSIRTWVEIKSMTWAASPGDKTPSAQAASTEDEAFDCVGGTLNWR